MKKFIKIISIFIICSLIVCGCEDTTIEGPAPTTSESDELKAKITNTEIGFFNGEFNDKSVVLKVRNDNDRPVYLNYSFEMFDKNKNKLYNKEVYVRVGSKDSAYVVAIQDLEEVTFDSYSYKLEVLKEELTDYDIIKSNVKTEYKDTGKKITVSFNNIGKRTTTAYGLLLFYKSNSLVAVKEVKSFNLTPYKIDEVSVDYPIKKIGQKISYDRIELTLNEVSTEL